MEQIQPTLISGQLCRALTQRCNDPNVAWPYHPRIGIGALLIDCLIQSLQHDNPPFKHALSSGQLSLKRNHKAGGNKRSKRLDLVISSNDAPNKLVAIEAKACMTAHAKARTRVIAELTSSLDALLDENADAEMFAIVVVNCGERFTSPLNLPGPNTHDASDGQSFSDALIRSISNNSDLKSILIIPIDFDNERKCQPIHPGLFRRPIDEVSFYKQIISAIMN